MKYALMVDEKVLQGFFPEQGMAEDEAAREATRLCPEPVSVVAVEVVSTVRVPRGPQEWQRFDRPAAPLWVPASATAPGGGVG